MSNFTEMKLMKMSIAFSHYSHPLNFCRTRTLQKRCLKQVYKIILYAIKTSLSRNLKITILHDVTKTKFN